MSDRLRESGDDPLELRIRSALDAQASTMTTLAPRRPVGAGGRNRARAIGHRWPAALLAAAAIVAVIVGIAIGFTMTRSGTRHAPAAVTTTTQRPAPSSTPDPTASPSSNGSISPIVFSPGQLALWPFTSTRDEVSWQSAYQASGVDAWHLDADATAVKFATDYLGFTNMSTVTSRTEGSAKVEIGVGFGPPGNATAAVITVQRSSSDAPWEATGATSPVLSISSPAAGATVGSTVTVSGQIIGVDESITVSVRQQGNNPVGQHCCQPAGTGTPWSIAVALSSSQPGVAAIVASTGGHLETVEKFAVVGVLVS
jgi:hypothetical protein